MMDEDQIRRVARLFESPMPDRVAEARPVFPSLDEAVEIVNRQLREAQPIQFWKSSEAAEKWWREYDRSR